MVKLLAITAALALMLLPRSAFACEEGERRVGPLCVIQTVHDIGSYNIGSSEVYFEDDPSKRVVWDGNGYVDRATRTRMVVIEKRTDKKGLVDMEVVYVWSKKHRKFIEQ